MSDLDDPDDAFDVSDPIPDRLVNLAHRLQWVLDHLADVDLTAVRLHLHELVDDLATIRGELVGP